MTKELFETIKNELLPRVTKEIAQQKGEVVKEICIDYAEKKPRLAMEAAKYVIWFGGGEEKETVSNKLFEMAKETLQAHPAMAFKASAYPVDLGEKSQKAINENAKVPQSVAETFWRKRPQMALNAAVRVVKDSEELETVQQKLIFSLVAVKKILETKLSATISPDLPTDLKYSKAKLLFLITICIT